MHMVVMRRDIYEAHPWAATSLLEAFIRSKRIGMARLGDVNALAVHAPLGRGRGRRDRGAVRR